jgi:3-dehydroquinate dehydratase
LVSVIGSDAFGRLSRITTVWSSSVVMSAMVPKSAAPGLPFPASRI